MTAEPHETPPLPQLSRPTGFSRRTKVFLGAGGLLVILAGAGFWRVYSAYADPQINLPPVRLPKQNAFDIYCEAGKLLVQKKQIGDVSVTGNHSTVADKAALVRANAAALRRWRQGFALRYCQPSQRSLTATFPYLVDFRNLTRLASLEGQVYAARGQYGNAMTCYLDGLQFGQQIAGGAPLTGRLVGIACQATARRNAWVIVDKLDVNEAKAAIRRMEEISTQYVPYANTLTEEKYAGQATLLEIFQDPDGFAAYLNTPDDSQPVSEKQSEESDREKDAEEPSTSNDFRLYFFQHNKTHLMDSYTNAMDALIKQAKQPYGVSVRMPPPVLTDDPFLRPLVEPDVTARIKDAAGVQTQNALLLVSLALHAFRKEQGTFPTSLTQLCPHYLSRLPDDVFAPTAGVPFRFKNEKDTYVLYSVGPDGKDDNGQPINNPNGSTEIKRRAANADSHGDIVAGINR